MPDCPKFTNCLAAQTYYTYVAPTVVNTNVTVQAPSQWYINEMWEDGWADVDEANMKTWNTIDYSTDSHSIVIEWREADSRQYFVENNTYCVGVITNNLKQKEGWRNEINAYDQERRSDSFILNAEFWFSGISSNIRIFYADWMRF